MPLPRAGFIPCRAGSLVLRQGRGYSKSLVRLDERMATGGPLMVVAPSGAGESSVLRAGLLAALACGALPAAGSADGPRQLLTQGHGSDSDTPEPLRTPISARRWACAALPDRDEWQKACAPATWPGPWPASRPGRGLGESRVLLTGRGVRGWEGSGAGDASAGRRKAVSPPMVWGSPGTGGPRSFATRSPWSGRRSRRASGTPQPGTAEALRNPPRSSTGRTHPDPIRTAPPRR